MNYSEELEASGIQILGWTVWYNVSTDASVDRTKFAELIRQHQVPITPMKPPKAANVFRRACENISKMKNIQDPTGGSWEFFMDDQGYSDTLVTRSLCVRPYKGPAQTVKKIAVATFHKETEQLRWEYDPVYFHNMWLENTFLEVQNSIKEFMTTNMEVIHSLPLRESIRKVIEGPMNGLLIKPGGGLYFLPLDEFENLQAIQDLFTECSGVFIQFIPLIKDDVQVWMILEHLTCNLVETAGECAAEIMAIKDSAQKPTAKKLTELGSILDDLETKKDLYSKLLGKRVYCREIRWAKESLETLWTGEE